MPSPLRERIAGSVLALSSQTPGTEVDLRARGATAWRSDLRRLHRAGFRAVDLLDGWLPLLSAAVDAAIALGLPLLSIGLHPRLRPDQKGSLWFREVPSTPDDTSEATWDLATTRIRAVCADIGRLAQGVRAANLGTNPDPGNLHRSAIPHHEHWLATLRGAIPHTDDWHLKNHTRSTPGPAGPFAVSVTALGEDDIDYRLAVGEPLRGGYERPFVVEHHGGDALDVQRRGRECLERLLDELAGDLADESGAGL